MKEEQRIIERVYTVDSSGLFTFYISKPQSLTDRYSDLDLLKRYRIFPNLNPTFYYTNYFIYTLKQYKVPSDKITIIRSYLVSIYVKIKYIVYLGKLLKLYFIIYLVRDYIKDEYMLIKLGISLLMYEDHLMLYDVIITFNCLYYMNTWHLLETLIKDNTLVRMTIDEKQTLMNAIDKKLVQHI